MVDTTFVLPCYPAEDTKVQASATHVCAGGPSLRASMTLARQGVLAAFAGGVGDDVDATVVEEQLNEFGVEARVKRTAG